MSVKLLILLGSTNAALAVILGAFGAHVLKARITPELLSAFQTGAQYHFYHALGLFAVAFVSTQVPDSGLPKWSGWLMQAGIVLFSGSLYAMAAGGPRWLGAITPLGGVAFIAAWLVLAAALISR